MPVLRILMGAVGFAGVLIWPVLCMLVSLVPAFHIGPPEGQGFSTLEVWLYVGAPLLAFVYYILVSVATPRRFIAVIGVALHLFLVIAILMAMTHPDGVLLAALVLGGVLSLLYESQSFSRRSAS